MHTQQRKCEKQFSYIVFNVDINIGFNHFYSIFFFFFFSAFRLLFSFIVALALYFAFFFFAFILENFNVLLASSFTFCYKYIEHQLVLLLFSARPDLLFQYNIVMCVNAMLLCQQYMLYIYHVSILLPVYGVCNVC